MKFLNRLNGWQRLGLLLSIVWALGVGHHSYRTEVRRAEWHANLAYKICSDKKILNRESEMSSCAEGKKAEFAKWMSTSYAKTDALMVAIAPIPFFWLAGFMILSFIRAQLIGFRSLIEWGKLTKLKRLFVVFCFGTALLVVFSGLIGIMNVDVDRLVPIAPFGEPSITRRGEDIVDVSGTWTRSGDTPGSEIGNPLQTSYIECDRKVGRCAEARAYVTGGESGLLAVDPEHYEIESWTSAVIVFKNEQSCSEELYTIDLNTESVNGAGRLTNETMPWCKVGATSISGEPVETRWSYRLSDGFKVYWALRQSARPWPLRVFQSVFGN